MSTKHLSKTRDINAEKRQERKFNTPKKLKKEEIKMDKLRNEFLLRREIKELGFAFINISNKIILCQLFGYVRKRFF